MAGVTDTQVGTRSGCLLFWSSRSKRSMRIFKSANAQLVTSNGFSYPHSYSPAMARSFRLSLIGFCSPSWTSC
jgi:hypothetical protein